MPLWPRPQLYVRYVSKAKKNPPPKPSSLYFHCLNNKVYFVPWSILQPGIFSTCCTMLFFVDPGQFGPKGTPGNDHQGDHVSLCISRFDTIWVNILIFKEFKSLRGRALGFIQKNLFLRTPKSSWKGAESSIEIFWENKIREGFIFFKCCIINLSFWMGWEDVLF